MIVADYPQNPAVEAAESFRHFAPEKLAFVGDHEPQIPIRQTFRFNKHVLQIEPGQLQLRLTEFPEIAVDPQTLECEVLGWGVRMPAYEAEKIPAAMAHRFLELFSKADQGNIQEEEQHHWVTILDKVDFQSFCIDRAQPHYMEGVIVTQQPHLVWVEWHDGAREKLTPPVSRPLMNLHVGDEFGAWVKLGKENRSIRIESLSLITPDNA